MRKLLLTALALGVTVVQAQYYMIPTINAGENPGGLNTEDEQPLAYLTANYSGYSQVCAPTTTDWSAAQNIPFSFNFNGTDYTQYYAAPSGIVTFTTSSGAAPSGANAALPDASIPDNSICAWGVNLAGANDAVVAKTFGTAPNRQHWVIWASASGDGMTGASQWTYWGIVLEETSNKVYIVDMRTYDSNGGNVSLSVGLQYDNSTALSVALSPNVGSLNTATSGNGSDPSDNTYYMFVPGTQPAVDLQMVSINVPKYIGSGNTGTITGRVRNLGANAVSSFDVEWTDGSNTFTTTVTGNVNSGSYKTFTCSDQVDPGPGVTTITVTAVIANDADLNNNSLSTTTTETAFEPTKVVVGEEATGTWCGWCPRGAVWMEYMAETYPDSWIGIAVHNSDPMEVSEYDTWMGGMISGYPSGVVDRNVGPYDPSAFETGYNDHIGDFAVADIDVDAYIDVDGNMEVTVSAHFAISSTDPMRLAAVVIQDGMTGTSSDWAQVNYYSSSSQNLPLEGAGHNWQTSPNPVPASEMVYDHVGRKLLGGINGAANSVPSSVTADDVVEYTYTTTLDESYMNDGGEISDKYSNLHVAGLLLDNTTGLILNAGGAHLAFEYEDDGKLYLNDEGVIYEWNEVDNQWETLGSSELGALQVAMYPNPTNGVLNISGVNGISQIVVYDVRGAVVMSQSFEGNSVDMSGLTPGVYSVSVTNNGLSAMQKVTVIQ